VELDGARAAHRRDAVAVVRFLAWLDRGGGRGRLHDEATLADRLAALRAEGEHFQEPSFDTISAAGRQRRHVPLQPPRQRAGTLEADSLYLVDSGGQYLDGTTDITRTVAIGDADGEMRELFTLVLKGHIALDQARFPRARRAPTSTCSHASSCGRAAATTTTAPVTVSVPFLSVHEGPQRIAKAWNAGAAAGHDPEQRAGLLPRRAFGIRCENLVYVREVEGRQSVPCCASSP
jgi:Xaa-Pro aminopeptidase